MTVVFVAITFVIGLVTDTRSQQGWHLQWKAIAHTITALQAQAGLSIQLRNTAVVMSGKVGDQSKERLQLPVITLKGPKRFLEGWQLDLLRGFAQYTLHFPIFGSTNFHALYELLMEKRYSKGLVHKH